MNIPTADSIRRARQFHDRRRLKAAEVITAMSRGLTLKFDIHANWKRLHAIRWHACGV